MDELHMGDLWTITAERPVVAEFVTLISKCKRRLDELVSRGVIPSRHYRLVWEAAATKDGRSRGTVKCGTTEKCS